MSEIKVGAIFYKKAIHEIGFGNKLPALREYKVEKVTPKTVNFEGEKSATKISLLQKEGFMSYTKELEKEKLSLAKNVELYNFFYFGKWQNNTACAIISSGKQSLIDKVQEMKDFIEREFKEYL